MEKLIKQCFTLKKMFFFTYNKRKSKDLIVSINVDQPLKKRFKTNDEVGSLTIKDNSGFSKEFSLYASEDFAKINFVKKFINTINFLIWG